MDGTLEVFGRLALALLLGGLIGVEREHSNRPAGLRTHVLVTMGSALVMMVSVDMWVVFSARGATNVDPGRIAAQVVSGIGFLGAGTILREGITIRGLTTAASLWVAAGIGLAVGAGYYPGAVATTIFSLATLVILARIERVWLYGKRTRSITLAVVDRPGQLGRVGSILGDHGVNIHDVRMRPLGDDLVEISLEVSAPSRDGFTRACDALRAMDGLRSLEFGS